MRIVSRMMLAAMLGLAAGCGGKSEPQGEPKPQPGPTPGGTSVPLDPSKGIIPATVPATWEMDPAKHTIPPDPVSGKVHGEAVTLDVQAGKHSLTFLVIRDGRAIELLELHLTDQEKTTEGLALTVKADQPAGADVPNVIVRNPANQAEPPLILRDKYSLSLKLGKREKGKLNGSMHLSLPDEKKSYVAGTFSADWVRELNELPGPDDAPFLQGKLTFPGAQDPNVWVGFVRIDPYNPAKGPVSDVVGTELKKGASEVRSPSIKPKMLMAPGENPGKDLARYELTKLEPGRYWVFATVKGGPATWKWVTIEPNSQITLDLTVETATFGSLEVTAPGTTESVALVPAGPPDKPWPESLVSSAASIADLYVNTAANKRDPAKPLTLKFPRLAPGKYEVWSGDTKVDVEIKANETAKVELKKK